MKKKKEIDDAMNTFFIRKYKTITNLLLFLATTALATQLTNIYFYYLSTLVFLDIHYWFRQSISVGCFWTCHIDIDIMMIIIRMKITEKFKRLIRESAFLAVARWLIKIGGKLSQHDDLTQLSFCGRVIF